MKMSVTRGLKELTLLDSRIKHAIQQLQIVDIKQKKYGDKVLTYNMDTSTFAEKARAKYTSVITLINRRQDIKSSIVTSNATTIIQVANREMSVASAIEFKKSISYKRELLGFLRNTRTKINMKIEESRAQIDQQVQKLVETNTGTDRKQNKDDYDTIAKPFIEANELKLVDPIKVDEKIDTLELEINSFDADIDIVLTESNSRTEIDIPESN